MVDLEALADLQTPWCLRVATTLRIAERIAAGSSTSAELATEAGCDAEALELVLRRLVENGVFEEPEPGHFALNAAAEALTRPEVRFGLDLEGIGGRMSWAWGTLPTYVRTGRTAYHEVFGRPFWEDLAAHPEVAASFDALMGPAGHGTPDPGLELAGGWEGVQTVVDVGGGTGAMLAELLGARPGLRGTLVDLPGTVARSADVLAGVADRVTTIGQSFFDPLPAGADLYLLKKVINDWPDDEATAILRRCAEAAAPAGRVVVLGGVSADGAARRLEIEMVLAGGKQRSLDEFAQLARTAGLDVVAAGRQPAGFVVECRAT
jgi:hypothetical protein